MTGQPTTDDMIHRLSYLIGQIQAIAFSTPVDDRDRMCRIRDLLREHEKGTP